MTKFIPLLTAALATLLMVSPVTAATVYENGAFEGTTGKHEISQMQSVSNTFSLVHASDLTSAAIGLWSLDGDTPTQLDWSIGSTAFSNNFGGGTATLSAVSNSYFFYPYEIDLATFSLSLTLGAGDYWLTLKNGVNNANGNIYWDISDGPSTAQYQVAGKVDGTSSEYFRLSGNDAAVMPPGPGPGPGPVAVPEPASILLLGVGMLGCVAARRRRARQAA